MKKLEKEQIEKYFNEYKESSETLEFISKKYHFSASYHFKKHGFIKKDLNKRRKTAINLNWCADSINNEFEAYIVGFWYADGWVDYNDQAGIKIKNTESDRNLLELIKNYISPNSEIKVKDNTILLKINSNLFCENLINLGCLREKTYKSLLIPKMDQSLLRHFIRGYFDADGTVFYDRQYLKSNICSINEDFLKKLKEILDINNIENRINVEIRQGKELKTPQGSISTTYKNMFRLYVSKKEALSKFKDFLYSDAKIYLSRKKDVFYKEDIELTK